MSNTPDRKALAERLRDIARSGRECAINCKCGPRECVMHAAAAALEGPEPDRAVAHVDLGYGLCPVQIEGMHHDRRYYFRARGKRFSLRLGAPGEAHEFAAFDGAEVLRGEIATKFEAGYMPHLLARGLVDWALARHEGELDAATPASPAPLQPSVAKESELDTEEYRQAVRSSFEDEHVTMFSVAYDWHDKPHRLVYDLCNEVDALRASLADLRALGGAPEVPDDVREAAEVIERNFRGRDDTELASFDYKARTLARYVGSLGGGT